MKISGNRFLVCCPVMQSPDDATTGAYELARHLMKCGADATVYTDYLAEPMSSLLLDAGIGVWTPDDGHVHALDDFDVIWSYSQLLPDALVAQLSGTRPERMPHFVFMHMGGGGPEETPWIWRLERRLSSLSLFESEEVRAACEPLLGGDCKTGIFRMPAPDEFAGVERRPSASPRILFAPASPSAELTAACAMLRDRGLFCQMAGRHGSRPIMGADDLCDYDAVVTSGSMTQRCLVSGTPVYVYGEDGGPGWMCDGNFAQSGKRGFSGHGCPRKEPSEIAGEIASGYDDARGWAARNRRYMERKFLMGNILPKVLRGCRTRYVASFDPDYAVTVSQCERLMRSYHRSVGAMRLLTEERDRLAMDVVGMNSDRERLVSQRDMLRKENESLTAQLADERGHSEELESEIMRLCTELTLTKDDLKSESDRRRECEDHIHGMYSSRTWRIGRFFTRAERSWERLQ